jgi:hypothetical protein
MITALLRKPKNFMKFAAWLSHRIIEFYLKKTVMITRDIEIEDLVRKYPFSVRFLMERHIKCIACGEPVWGTLEEAAKEKGYDDEAITGILNELNEMAEKQDGISDI